MSPVTELPPPGGTSLTDQMSMRAGGAGANAALAFAEAGLAGAADRLRRRRPARALDAASSSSRSGWPASWWWSAGEPSGLTVALESPARDRTFLTYLGVNAVWEPSMIPADALDCDQLLFCDYFVAPGLQGEAAGGCSTRPAPRARGRSSTPPGTRTASRRRPAPSCARC